MYNLLDKSRDVAKIIQEKGLAQIRVSSALLEIAEELLQNNPQTIADYKGGKTNALGFLMWQTMRFSKDQGNPHICLTNY